MLKKVENQGDVNTRSERRKVVLVSYRYGWTTDGYVNELFLNFALVAISI